jgi:hypothetical protein
MKKFSILLLIYLLSVGSAIAGRLETTNVSFTPGGVSNYVLDISNYETDLTTLSEIPQTSQFASETDAVPPTFWIVGLGLCLVFIGYKMKNKAE